MLSPTGFDIDGATDLTARSTLTTGENPVRKALPGRN